MTRLATVACMREQFTHASNMLINFSETVKEEENSGVAVAGGETEGDGWALLAVEDPACCSRWRQLWWGEDDHLNGGLWCCYDRCSLCREEKVVAGGVTYARSEDLLCCCWLACSQWLRNLQWLVMTAHLCYWLLPVQRR